MQRFIYNINGDMRLVQNEELLKTDEWFATPHEAKLAVEAKATKKKAPKKKAVKKVDPGLEDKATLSLVEEKEG